MFEDKDRPVVVLSSEESWKLLEHSSAGRLALCALGEPDIFPINFHAHDGVVLLRTTPGDKLAQLTVNNTVALEADAVTEDQAWSVVVKGTARILERSAEIEAADKLPLIPWVRTVKSVYVEVTPRSVSGRLFNLGPEPERY